MQPPTNDISKFEGQTLKIVGTIRDEPQIKIFPNDMTQQRFIVEVSSAGKNSASGAIILTSYYKPNETLKPARIGDKITAEGKIKFITNYKNPGQIDTATRLKSDGITARMSASKGGVEIVNSGQLTSEEINDLVRLSYNLSAEKTE